ncbi:hypothetical protein ES703_12541 [subsurface metagenome]
MKSARKYWLFLSHRHYRLAAAHIPLQEAIHHPSGLEVGPHFAHHPHLGIGELKGKAAIDLSHDRTQLRELAPGEDLQRPSPQGHQQLEKEMLIKLQAVDRPLDPFLIIRQVYLFQRYGQLRKAEPAAELGREVVWNGCQAFPACTNNLTEPAAVQSLGLQTGGAGIQGNNLAGVQRVFILFQEVEIGMHHLQVPVEFHLPVNGHPVPHPEASLDPLNTVEPNACQGTAVIGNGDLKVFSPAGALDALTGHSRQDGGLIPDFQVGYERGIATVEVAAGKVIEQVFNRLDTCLSQSLSTDRADALDVLDGVGETEAGSAGAAHHAG